jgi:hypothetical protein
MTAKALAQSAAVPADGVRPGDSWLSAPLTTEDRLVRIRALGQRIDGHIQFMCAVGSLNGTSAEAKERAVTAFYERMVVLERQLDRIQEDLQLG